MNTERLTAFHKKSLLKKSEFQDRQFLNGNVSESSPDTDNLIALANLYGITIDELLNGTDAPKKISEDQPKEEPDKESPKTRNFPMMKKKESTNADFTNGFTKENGKDKVHIGWDGIHVESKDGDNVHVGTNGVHVETKDGHYLINKSTPPF